MPTGQSTDHVATVYLLKKYQVKVPLSSPKAINDSLKSWSA